MKGDYIIHQTLNRAARIWKACGNGVIAWSPNLGFVCWLWDNVRGADQAEAERIENSWQDRKGSYRIDRDALDDLIKRVQG